MGRENQRFPFDCTLQNVTLRGTRRGMVTVGRSFFFFFYFVFVFVSGLDVGGWVGCWWMGMVYRGLANSCTIQNVAVGNSHRGRVVVGLGVLDFFFVFFFSPPTQVQLFSLFLWIDVMFFSSSFSFLYEEEYLSASPWFFDFIYP